MPPSFSFGKFQFDLSPGQASSPRRDPESPFLLLLAGDFSGRANRGIVEPLAGRRPVRIDCDNSDEVLSRLGARLRLEFTEPAVAPGEVRFNSLDDFHPDRLIENIPSLKTLLNGYKRLKDPGTASAAMAELKDLLAGSATVQENPGSPPASAPVESAQDTLARLMGKSSGAASPSTAPQPSPSGIDVNSLIKSIVAPGVVPAATPEQTAARTAVELDLTRQLGAVLHQPDFQSLESNWRGLDCLVREFGGEENIQLWVLDASKAELAADLKVENLLGAGLFKILREQPWAILAGAFGFEATVGEIELLGRLAKVAAALNAPFLAGASSRFVACDSLLAHPHPDEWTQPLRGEVREAWEALRKLEEGAFLGLTLPRVIMRQPYGKESEPIESFPFEELSGQPSHESYLWGCGSLVPAFVLADAFRSESWELTGSGPGELDDLPVHRISEQGERTVKPCAEVWLSDRAAERIQAEGLMPLQSVKGRGAVRLSNLQSISSPPQPLAIRGA